MPRSQHSAFPNRVAPWGYAFYAYATGSDYSGESSGWRSVFNGLYRCPHDRRTERWSYGFNVYFELTAEETLGPTWTRLSQAPVPSATVLFGELLPTASADHAMAHFWVQLNAPPEIDPKRHGTTTSSAYLDGHAADGSFESVFDQAQSVDRYNPATAR